MTENDEEMHLSSDFTREFNDLLRDRFAVTYFQVVEALQDHMPTAAGCSPSEYVDELIKWLSLKEIDVTSPLNRGDTRQYNSSRLALVQIAMSHDMWKLGTDGMLYAATPDGLLRLDVSNKRTPTGLDWGFRISSGPVEKLQKVEGDPLSRVMSPRGGFMPIAENPDLGAIIESAIKHRLNQAPSTPSM